MGLWCDLSDSVVKPAILQVSHQLKNRALEQLVFDVGDDEIAYRSASLGTVKIRCLLWTAADTKAIVIDLSNELEELGAHM